MNKKKPFSFEEFKAIYSKVPRLCVELIVKTPEGIVFTLRQLSSWKGKWHIPGGTVFYREKVKDAVTRVAMEELGTPVRIDKVLGYIEYSGEEEEREQGFGSTIGLAFLCFTEATEEEMKVNNEASEIKVFKELPDNLINGQREFLTPIWDEIQK